jgi:flagellar protein FliL
MKESGQGEKTDEDGKVQDATGGAGRGMLKKRLIVIGGILILIGGAVAAIFVFAPSLIPGPIKGIVGMAAAPPHEEKKAVEVQGHIYSLDPFLVNLADKERPRYLKVRMDLESQEVKPSEDYEKRMPQLRDAVLTILSAKTYGEISDSQGKTNLKAEILQKVNQMMKDPKIKGIFFTEFVVQ